MYRVHEDLRKFRGEGVGGAVGLILYFFVAPVTAFLLPHEIAGAYESKGRTAPITALNGLWMIPGTLIIVGPLVWFIRTNNAVNELWANAA